MTDLPPEAITWRFVVEDALLCCIECGENLTENGLTHAASCAQVRQLAEAIRQQVTTTERQRLVQVINGDDFGRQLCRTLDPDDALDAVIIFTDLLRDEQEPASAESGRGPAILNSNSDDVDG